MTRKRRGTKRLSGCLSFALLVCFCALVSFAEPIEANPETAIR